MCTDVWNIFTGVQNTFVISISINQIIIKWILRQFEYFLRLYIFTVLIYTQLTVNDKNNTSTRPRSCWKDAAVIITSIVTSDVPYLKWYICRIVRSAVIFIFGLKESRTTGSNLYDTPVDLVRMVYVVCSGLWKKRSSPGNVYRVPDITLNFGYCNEDFMID